ncbi:hypothetical protein F4776DRAFT_665406 [Hypoxylon sp. NC0597]|nr:hypothetical protein F4776DRAFT_665406 [Hypoxylon sp. NC0597]
MAPKKQGKVGKDENTTEKKKRARTGVPDSGYETDPNGRPAAANAIGVVLNNELFECRVLVNGRRCGSRMFNEKVNIGNHNCKQHTGPKSAYKKGQAHGEKWPCTYGCKNRYHNNFHSLLAHARTAHDHRGESHGLKTASMKLRKERQKAHVNGGKYTGDIEDEEDDSYEEDSDDEDDDDWAGTPDRHDHDADNDQDPPGPSGTLPTGITT